MTTPTTRSALRPARTLGATVGLLALTAAACAANPARPASDATARPAALPASALSPLAAQADTGTIVVSGSGSVQVPSDRVRIRVAVETEGETAGAASAANAALARAVLDAVRPLTGEDDRLETTGFGVSPIYGREAEFGESRITGYRVQNAVLATLSDVDAAGPVLDAALGAGANRVDDLTFFASDVSDAEDEALRRAVADARRRAEVAAAALGVPLGSILEVRTSTGGAQPGPRMALMADMRAESTPIEAGSNTVTANVTITWRLGTSGGG